MTTFDPMDPTTWNSAPARTPKATTQPRSRFPRTEEAVRELVFALEGARHALSALEDPDYFELEVARFEERIGHPYEVPECLRAEHEPDPEFARPDDRTRRFRDHLKTAMLFAACAMHNLILAETAEGMRRQKRRRRPARA